MVYSDEATKGQPCARTRYWPARRRKCNCARIETNQPAAIGRGGIDCDGRGGISDRAKVRTDKGADTSISGDRPTGEIDISYDP